MENVSDTSECRIVKRKLAENFSQQTASERDFHFATKFSAEIDIIATFARKK